MLQWHLIGPLTIHIYGICIALGLISFLFMLHRDSRFKLLQLNTHFDALLWISIINGIIGGRILYCLVHAEDIVSWTDILKITNGGLAVSGALLSIIISLVLYFWYYQLTMFPILDVLALYAPLIHIGGRIGCFLIGCCHGSLWNGPWSVIYRSEESVAILHHSLHPSQLYSVFALSLAWIWLYRWGQKQWNLPGQIFAWYMIIIGLERFANEFFRYEYAAQNAFLTTHQWISLSIALVGIILLLKPKKQSL